MRMEYAPLANEEPTLQLHRPRHHPFNHEYKLKHGKHFENLLHISKRINKWTSDYAFAHSLLHLGCDNLANRIRSHL